MFALGDLCLPEDPHMLLGDEGNAIGTQPPDHLLQAMLDDE